jgi:light-regulated signal transduction histidine kinase (bacteriophytochrome)
MQTALASYRDMAALARSRRQLVGIIVDELDKLSEMSSELVRNPLKEVLTTVQELHRQLQDGVSAEQLRMLENVKTLTTNMYLQVDDLVRLTETGNFNDEQSLLKMNEVLQEATAALAQEISDFGATVIVGALPSVTGSRRQLLRLLVNLLSNALQFRSEAEPEIRIDSRSQGDCWCFQVDDNGIGIPIDERQAVFSLLRRSGQKLAAVGSGIGLNICRKVVRWHGGKIWIDDSPMGSTRIEFTLPVTDS